jgi:hypothetical protein
MIPSDYEILNVCPVPGCGNDCRCESVVGDIHRVVCNVCAYELICVKKDFVIRIHNNIDSFKGRIWLSNILLITLQSALRHHKEDPITVESVKLTRMPDGGLMDFRASILSVGTDRVADEDRIYDIVDGVGCELAKYTSIDISISPSITDDPSRLY